MSEAKIPAAAHRSETYLGADRSSGAEFWLSGPHVYSVSAQCRRPRHVCSVAGFNRLQRCGRGYRAARFSIGG